MGNACITDDDQSQSREVSLDQSNSSGTKRSHDESENFDLGFHLSSSSSSGKYDIFDDSLSLKYFIMAYNGNGGTSRTVLNLKIRNNL